MVISCQKALPVLPLIHAPNPTMPSARHSSPLGPRHYLLFPGSLQWPLTVCPQIYFFTQEPGWFSKILSQIIPLSCSKLSKDVPSIQSPNGDLESSNGQRPASSLILPHLCLTDSSLALPPPTLLEHGQGSPYSGPGTSHSAAAACLGLQHGSLPRFIPSPGKVAASGRPYQYSKEAPLPLTVLSFCFMFIHGTQHSLNYGMCRFTS